MKIEVNNIIKIALMAFQFNSMKLHSTNEYPKYPIPIIPIGIAKENKKAKIILCTIFLHHFFFSITSLENLIPNKVHCMAFIFTSK